MRRNCAAARPAGGRRYELGADAPVKERLKASTAAVTSGRRGDTGQNTILEY